MADIVVFVAFVERLMFAWLALVVGYIECFAVDIGVDIEAEM